MNGYVEGAPWYEYTMYIDCNLWLTILEVTFCTYLYAAEGHTCWHYTGLAAWNFHSIPVKWEHALVPCSNAIGW